MSSTGFAKSKRQQPAMNGVAYIASHELRTIRYPDPLIQVGHTVRTMGIDSQTGKVMDIFSGGTCAWLPAVKNHRCVTMFQH